MPVSSNNNKYGIHSTALIKNNTRDYPNTCLKKCQPEIRASQPSVQLPVIAFLGYGITNSYWIGSTRYVFEDRCRALLYLYIYVERY